MVKVFIFILLGGLIGPDGYAVSPGILRLAQRLDAFGEVSTYSWTAQGEVTQRIAALDPSDKVVLIGYSGGGFAITEIAEQLNANAPHKVDLLIAYDPSPAWSMKSLGKNVAKAICYCNSRPLMLGLGGAQLRGQSVETVPISEQHLAVQFDESLHKRTIAEIEKLAAAPRPK
jgi:pimeloyl-ACP methyl ester carboxylesterase